MKPSLRMMLLSLLLVIAAASEGSNASSRIIPASEVLAKIKMGLPVEYDNVCIEGNLDLNQLGLPTRIVDRGATNSDRSINQSYGLSENIRLVNSSINIRDSLLDGCVEFNSTIFQKAVNFENTKFNQSANFNGAQFSDFADFSYSQLGESASFWGSKFNGTAWFISTMFRGKAEFGKSQFTDYADFSGSRFNELAHFLRTQFKGPALFRQSQFNKTAYFGESQFEDNADFSGSRFNELAYFWKNRFNNNAQFWKSQFNGQADFRASKFEGLAQLWDSQFNETVYFQQSQFKGPADFGSSRFSKDAYFDDAEFNGVIDFNDSRFSKDAFFENATFKGKLSFIRTSYYKLYIRWYNIKGGLAYDDTTYISLMKNFRDLGYIDDYDSCYIQNRIEHRNQDWVGMTALEATIRKFFDIFLEYLYGYGKKPLNPLVWSFITVVIFGLFWKWAGLAKTEWPPIKRPQNANFWLYAFGFSITVFLSGMKLFVDPPDIPILQGHSSSFIKGAFQLERILGALFYISFFLAIGATIIRQ